MAAFTHSYFGTLNTDHLDAEVDVCWERMIAINGTEVDTQLWAGRNTVFQAAKLDAFAALLDKLPALDTHARAELCRYLKDDPSYLEFHVEELSDISVIAELLEAGQDGVPSIAAFVQKMQLRGVGLWYDADARPAILDYMIDPDNSDQILAVKLDLDGEVGSIDWES